MSAPGKRYALQAVTIALSALLLACGLSTLATEPPTDEPTIASEQATAPQQPTSTPQPSTSGLVCEDPPPVEIALGSTVASEIGEPVWTQCYWVQVPEGLTSLTLELSGLSADLSLFAGYAFMLPFQYHMGEFWQSIEADLADEAIVIENPKAGPYLVRVGVAGLREPSSFTLGVRSEPETTASVSGAALPDPLTCSPPATNVEIGGTATGEIPQKDQSPLAHEYFCVQVPEGVGSLTIRLTDLTGSLDLGVRRSVPLEWADRSRSSELEVVIDKPVPGAYYIDVFASFQGASSSFTLSVNSP